MQISKIVTTVVTTVCASTAVASPAYANDGGPGTDITSPPHGGPPDGGKGNGNGNIKCGQDDHSGWDSLCCTGGGAAGPAVCTITNTVDTLLGGASICPDNSNQQQLCCSNTGSGNQICITNSGEIETRALRMV